MKRRLPAPATLRCLSAAVGLALFAGCAAGPDFQKPEPPKASGYLRAPPATIGTGASPDGVTLQSFDPGLDIPGDWWTVFHSQPLDALVKRALKNNPDLEAAQAALAAARETALAQEGGYFPSVSAGISASRQKTSAALSPTPNSGDLYFNLYTPQVSVSYVPDVFGLNRRSVEFLDAQAEQARFALIATHIALSANVVNTAIQVASLQAQIDATLQLIADNDHMLRVLRAQFAQGYASRLDVAAQESAAAAIAATLPPLQKQLAQQEDLLEVLTGFFPGQGPDQDLDLASLQLPATLPFSVPSQLVEQRPDVRQAEENLHAASAQIGIAAAERLPSFTLTADAGAMALAVDQIFKAGTGFWGVAADVTQPLFDGGALRHKEQAARGAYDQAAAQYRSTVLTAVQNVADTLHALRQDEEALTAAIAAKQAADTTLSIARKQWQSGYAGYLSVLNAEQAEQQASINLVQAQASRFSDTAALYQALGGGWWNRAELSKD